MSEPDPFEPPEEKERVAHAFRSLQELIDHVSGRALAPIEYSDAGLAEHLPFPFLAIVGQPEMKLALVLGLINPAVGGILLIGPRGTAKTTSVRSLLDLLPDVERSKCYFGCLPEDIESGGIDAVCPDCARKYGAGEALTAPDRVRLIELPLNARIEDVVGGIDERAAVHERLRVRRGILAHADRNLLYIDEVNLLPDEIIDAILDASAQGSYTVRRGPVSSTYRSRFLLVGSMNPEEGRLRPQIQDRFGMRVLVRGLEEAGERLEAYRRVQAFQRNPRDMTARYAAEMAAAGDEIRAARARLPKVQIDDQVARPAIALIQSMGIDSLRAEITWFEAARAYVAADGREQVTLEDLRAVAPLALRLRRSAFMQEYFHGQNAEEQELGQLLAAWSKEKPTAKKTARRKSAS